MIPPEQRMPEARELVEQGAYFVLHAPRQTGKTTLLRSLAQSLTAEGRIAALYFSCETAEPAGDDFVQAQRAILGEIREAASLDLPPELAPPPLPEGTADLLLLRSVLAPWARQSPLPLALFFDEIDAVQGESLRAVLRQLRAGYSRHLDGFPYSVVLCGLRDVRDYKAASGGDTSRLGTSSPFNVKLESMRLGNFDESEVCSLYGQHERETGQAFTPEAQERAFELTGGQPWLVNALAREVLEKVRIPAPTPITREHVEEAKERLILARATHLDSLVARLHEPRVRRLMGPMMAGDEIGWDREYDDDVSYLRDLGLVATKDPLRIANPIYKEVILRVLTNPASGNIYDPPRSFVRGDGSLDLRALLTEFAAFWREQGDSIAAQLPYHEVAAQLVLMAYLQRVVNGGGYIDREYGVGTRRIDLLVRWPLEGLRGKRWQREALELKMRRDGEADPAPKGLEQLDAYLTRLGLTEGTLVVFDRRTTAPPVEDRVRMEEGTTPGHGHAVTILHL